MTPQIIKELKAKAIKRRIKCRLENAKILVINGNDYAIDPKTGFFWEIKNN